MGLVINTNCDSYGGVLVVTEKVQKIVLMFFVLCCAYVIFGTAVKTLEYEKTIYL